MGYLLRTLHAFRARGSRPFAPAGHATPRLFVTLCLAFAFTGLLAAGCTLFGPRVDPYADIRQNLNAGFPITDAELDALPVYSITTRIDPVSAQYTGTLTLSLPITGSAALDRLYFRSYPNLITFGGNLQVTGASIDGANVNFGPAADGTAVELIALKPLEPGARAEVWLAFSGSLPDPSQPGAYTIFGSNEEVLGLTNFYPILAGRRGDDWALDIPHPRGDVGFHMAALYRARVSIPPNLTLVATGTEITRTVAADGWETVQLALGPAREFTVLLSPRFQVIETEALGTRIRSYYYPEDADAARSALYSAAAALRIYSDRFGPYPYRDMAVVQAPLTFHGMEFPGVNLIGSQVYNRYTQDLETLVVHEVAHQWWYNQVGSDQVRTPWLDEGLAEFTMYYYYEGRYGEPVAERLRQVRWELPVRGLVAGGNDRPIGLTVRDYTSHYETLVYGKGALFFATLRDELGPEKFEELLRTYLARYRWRIATPAEFQAVVEEVAGRDMSALFDEWVYGSATAQQ
ncbi:MAG: Aminopeptidase N [Chloroflexi bacterium ADurb.Bin325]|nr:MAG: Aminopeptidase N [Chloroflexi bacterium ADurb.Bin325]